MNYKVQNYLSHLIYILPFLLLTGSFLPDLMISIVGIVFIYYSIRYKMIEYYNNIYFKTFIIFYLYILLISIFSDFPFLSLESSLFYFRFGIFSLAIWFLIDQNKDFIKKFRFFLIITFVFCLCDGYYQFFFRENIIGLSSDSNYRLINLGGQLTLGNTLARLMPLLLAMLVLIKSNRFNNFIFFVVIFILTDILIFLSGERTAFLLLMISTLFIIFLINRFKILRLASFIFSILIIFFITLSIETVKNRMIDVTVNQMGLNSANDNIEDEIIIFTPHHTSHYITAFKIFLDKPIFGHAPKTYRVLCSDIKFNYNEYSCATHPHNIYLQLLSETGLVGSLYLFVPFILLIYLSGKQALSFVTSIKPSMSDYQVCLSACILLTLWPIVPSLNFFNNWNSIVIYLPIGFLLSSLNEKNNF